MEEQQRKRVVSKMRKYQVRGASGRKKCWPQEGSKTGLPFRLAFVTVSFLGFEGQKISFPQLGALQIPWLHIPSSQRSCWQGWLGLSCMRYALDCTRLGKFGTGHISWNCVYIIPRLGFGILSGSEFVSACSTMDLLPGSLRESPDECFAQQLLHLLFKY